MARIYAGTGCFPQVRTCLSQDQSFRHTNGKDKTTNPFRRDYRPPLSPHPLFAAVSPPPIQMNVALETNSNWIAGVASLDFVVDSCASVHPIKCGRQPV